MLFFVFWVCCFFVVCYTVVVSFKGKEVIMINNSIIKDYANDYLAEYGFKLGRFDAAKGDRYKLVELGGNDVREGSRI